MEPDDRTQGQGAALPAEGQGAALTLRDTAPHTTHRRKEAGTWQQGPGKTGTTTSKLFLERVITVGCTAVKRKRNKLAFQRRLPAEQVREELESVRAGRRKGLCGSQWVLRLQVMVCTEGRPPEGPPT